MADSNCKQENAKFHLRPSIRKWVTENLKESDIEDLVASVTRPCGKSKKVQLYMNKEETYSVAFQPKESGFHTLNVLRSNDHVRGSPFEFDVSEFMTGGWENVFAYGTGLIHALVEEEALFNIVTAEAGAGKLDVSVHGPSKADITYSDGKDGSGLVSYIVTEPGSYSILVKFESQHIHGSPFEVTVEGSESTTATTQNADNRNKVMRHSDIAKLCIAGDGLRRGTVGKKANFVVDCSSCESNVLIVGIVGSSGPCEDILLKEVDEKCYEVVYIPAEVGEFIIVVKWGDDDVLGSPFQAIIS